MQRISFITKCFIWLAALLAPAQAIFAMRCQCDHSTAEHVEHRHDHVHRAAGSQRHQHDNGTAACCASATVSTSHAPCQCDHHCPPQQAGPIAFQFRGLAATHLGVVHFSASPRLPALPTNGSAYARQTASALETCAVLCRFLA